MFGAYMCMQATERARNSAQGKLLNFFFPCSSRSVRRSGAVTVERKEKTGPVL